VASTFKGFQKGIVWFFPLGMKRVTRLLSELFQRRSFGVSFFLL
jgi:hypothetical protein